MLLRRTVSDEPCEFIVAQPPWQLWIFELLADLPFLWQCTTTPHQVPAFALPLTQADNEKLAICHDKLQGKRLKMKMVGEHNKDLQQQLRSAH